MLHDKASGYGIVRLDPDKQTITMECWRLLFDANDPKPEDQFPGWPKTINVQDNYGRKAVAWLPTLKFESEISPVVHIENDKGKHVYSLRVLGDTFSPKVFSEGGFTVIVEDPETGKKVTISTKSQKDPGGELSVKL